MKVIFRLLILLGIIALPLIVSAQDTTLSQVVDLGDNYSISLPADWKVTKVDSGEFSVKSDNVALTIFTPTYVDGLGLDISEKTNVIDALISLYAQPPENGKAERDLVQKTLYDGRLAAAYTDLNDSATDTKVVVLSMNSGSPGYLIIAANKGQLSVESTTLSAIIASFNSSESSGTSATGGAASGGAESTPESGAGTGGATQVTCTVSADSANSAQLRVGPGTNRGAIAFLPVKVDINVTGRIQLKDGSIWYQLDKSQAAPHGTAAAQLWVAADQVTATGDCDQVGDTSAPPVIPGHVAPPPTAVSGGGTTTTPGNGGGAASGTVPQTGAWVLSINPTTNASCAGGQNVPIPSDQVFEVLSFGGTITQANNSSFQFDGDVFTRLGNSNSFGGSYTFDDGTNSQMRFDLSSPTSMSGQVVGNFTVDGTACSATATFVVNHG